MQDNIRVRHRIVSWDYQSTDVYRDLRNCCIDMEAQGMVLSASVPIDQWNCVAVFIGAETLFPPDETALEALTPGTRQ